MAEDYPKDLWNMICEYGKDVRCLVCAGEMKLCKQLISKTCKKCDWGTQNFNRSLSLKQSEMCDCVDEVLEYYSCIFCERKFREAARTLRRYRFTFGKYKGQKFIDVMNTDQGYINWLVEFFSNRVDGPFIRKFEGNDQLTQIAINIYESAPRKFTTNWFTIRLGKLFHFLQVHPADPEQETEFYDHFTGKMFNMKTLIISQVRCLSQKR
jgi:hypothetical protein